MTYEDDKAQLEFLADPMRVREQKRLDVLILAWLFAMCLFIAWAIAGLWGL